MSENIANHCHFTNRALAISGVFCMAIGLSSPCSSATNISSEVSKRFSVSLAIAFKIIFSSQLGISGR